MHLLCPGRVPEALGTEQSPPEVPGCVFCSVDPPRQGRFLHGAQQGLLGAFGAAWELMS